LPSPMTNGRTGTPLAEDRHEDIRSGAGPASPGAEPAAFRSTPERVSTLRFYLSVIGRRRLPMLIAFLVPVVAAVALTVTAKKEYQGSALVVINRQSLSDQLTGAPDPTASSSDFVNIITTDADAARSIQVANRVAHAVPDAHLSGTAILAQATITPKQDADIVEFAVRDADPSLAQRLSTEFAREFVAYEQTRETGAINAILANVDARLARARQEGDRSLVSGLTARDQQLRTLLSLETPDNYVVTATTKASLVSPRKGLNLALGVIAGLALAVLVAAALEALDTRVRSRDEVESLVEAPVLGRLGTPRTRDTRRVLSLVDPGDPAAEPFRILRTNLQLQTLLHPARVMMVSGATAGEGKSLTVANLAVAEARAGRDVILVDLDLRRPAQDVLFDTGGRSPGVTDVLLGHVSLDQAMTEIPIGSNDDGGRVEGSLRLLRSGSLPPDPGELVASDHAERLIEGLRAKADVVYVDCPPMLVAGDALAISRYCDAIIVVTRLSQARRSSLNDLAGALSRTPARIAGLIITGDTQPAGKVYA
jgi:capsular exopolysaccharide synthesis family protein